MRRSLRGMTIFLGAVLMAAPLLAAEAPAEDPFAKLLGYKMGENAAACDAVANLARDSFPKPDERKKVEQQLLAALASPQATPDCKQFVCRQLVVVGSPASVPALAALLPDEAMSHMARYALARIAGPEAGKALRDALGTVKGQPLLGVIGSLGDRRDTEAVAALAALAKGADEAVAEAAVAALGKIGGDDALAAADAAAAADKPKLAAVGVDAKLRIADLLLGEKNLGKARAIYESLAGAKAAHVRVASLRGFVLTGGGRAVDIALKALQGEDKALQAAAIGLLRDLPGEAATKAYAEALPKLGPAVQVLVLDALTDRGDKAACPAVLAAIKSEDPAIRAAALAAIGALGDASAVPVLVASAGSEKAEEASAARQSLTRLAAPGVDEAIVAALKDANPKGRAELVRTLAARRATAAVPALIALVSDPDENVRREAFEAIGALADEKALPDLVKLLVSAEGDAPRRAAEKAVTTVATRLKSEDDRTAALLAALPAAPKDGKMSLLRVLAKFGGAKPLAAVRECLKDPDAQVGDAALRALSAWPEAAAADALLDLIKTTQNQTHRVLALRGYVRLVALPSDRPATDTLKRCQEAVTLANTLEEKKLVLSAMASVHHPGALAILEPYGNTPELKAEAEAAIKAIKAAVNAPTKATASLNAGKAMNALDGKPDTRWDTGTPMRPDMWFQLEFGMERAFTKITLDASGSGGDFPRGYEVYVARDPEHLGQPVAKGEGKTAITEIVPKPASGRFLRIVQTGKAEGSFWSIHELKVEAQ